MIKSLYEHVGRGLENWLAMGLLIQLVAVLVIDSGYGTWVYLSFYLPLLLIITLKFRQLFDVFMSAPFFYSMFPLFLFYFAISVLWGEQGCLIKELKASLLVFLYIIGVAIIARKERVIRMVLSVFVISAAIIGLAFIIKTYFIDGADLMHRIKSSGFSGLKSLGNASRFGAYFGATFIMGCFLARGKSYFPKSSILIFFAILSLFAGVFTYSRTMWAGILLIGFMYMVMNKQYKLLLYIFISGLILTSFILWLYPEIFNQFVYRQGLSYRPQIWMETIRLIMKEPLLGYGSGSEFIIFVTQIVNNEVQSTVTYHAHNIYLSMFYYAGLLGGALYIILLYMNFIRMKTYLDDYLVWMALGIMLFSMTEQFFDVMGIVSRPNEYYLLAWLPFGVLIGRSYTIDAKYNKKQMHTGKML